MEAVDYKLIDSNKEDYLVASAVNIFKALGDETRLRIMNALLEKPLTVNGIVSNTSVSQSCVSHQLKFLKKLRLVKSERRVKCIVYSLDDEHIIDLIAITYIHVKEEIDDNDWK